MSRSASLRHVTNPPNPWQDTTIAWEGMPPPTTLKVIEDLAPQVYHTHCRVGYDHGPQVPDPRAPEWLPYMEGHERW